MIRIIATVAMDFGILPTKRADLELLPEGSHLIFGVKMAKALGKPIAGRDCSVFDPRGSRGWGQVDALPRDCIVVGGMKVIRFALYEADRVTLLVKEKALGGMEFPLNGYELKTTTPLEGGDYVLDYARVC